MCDGQLGIAVINAIQDGWYRRYIVNRCRLEEQVENDIQRTNLAVFDGGF